MTLWKYKPLHGLHWVIRLNYNFCISPNFHLWIHTHTHSRKRQWKTGSFSSSGVIFIREWLKKQKKKSHGSFHNKYWRIRLLAILCQQKNYKTALIFPSLQKKTRSRNVPLTLFNHSTCPDSLDISLSLSLQRDSLQISWKINTQVVLYQDGFVLAAFPQKF